MKEDGTPFKIVLDNSLEINRVIMIPSRITAVSIRVENTDWKATPKLPAKNMVIMAIRVGKRPLQGTKLLVMVAISRSLGESMIRHPTIPAALHPNPMHIVNIIL